LTALIGKELTCLDSNKRLINIMSVLFVEKAGEWGHLHPFRLINPGQEVTRNMDVREVSLSVFFAGLYAVLLVFLAPISFGPVQLRIADCLLPLAALFGWPVIFGATIGCLIGNFAGGIIAFGAANPIDVIFGSIANLIATYVIFKSRRYRLLGCILGSLIIGMIVGGYLWLFVPAPKIGGFALPVWAAMMLSISISSLVTVAVIGYMLLIAISRPSVIKPIKSKGLKVYA